MIEGFLAQKGIAMAGMDDKLEDCGSEYGAPNFQRERRLGVEHEQELAMRYPLRFGVCGIDNALCQTETKFEVLGDDFLTMFVKKPADDVVHQR